MKKTISGIMLILFIIGSFGIALNIQPTHTQPKTITGADNRPTVQEGTNPTNSASQNQPQENGNVDTSYNENNANPETSRENTNLEKYQADDSSRSRVVPNPDRYATMDPHPPDGRIFFDSTPPYAYIPTYSPKNFNIPINVTSASPTT